jgi:hypothetical protein
VPRPTHEARRGAGRLASTSVLAALALAVAQAACQGPDAERGQRLFTGDAPLVARIAGHDSTLPPHASRCINCHATGAGDARTAGSASFGGPLTPQRLTGLHVRRGGPPSRFDEAALCRLLRTGVDPAHIVLPSTMPRYDVDEADCRALWVHLNRSPA